MAFQNEGGVCLHEIEHSESESESEEWLAEWDESWFPTGLLALAPQNSWNVAHLHNVEILEQLNDRPLLDPPEA